MSLHVSRAIAQHQEVKIALHSLWYHHIYRWPSRAQVERGLSQPVHEMTTCFDLLMMSTCARKHVEA